MQSIKKNPYRTVGLLVGATAREQEKQIKRLKQYLDAEQEIEDDFSFPTLGAFQRTLNNVSDAASKLNRDSDKMHAALFWFYKGNPITDEPALDFLKESDQQNSTDIWAKLTASGEVSHRNSSAFQNYSTLLLCNAFKGSNINSTLLEQGISLKLKFLESDFINDFKALSTDETYSTSKKELQLMFLNQFLTEMDMNDSVISATFMNIIQKEKFSAKEDFLKGFVQKPIEQIEKKIENSRNKRKANAADANQIGKDLYHQTIENLNQLASILGKSNIKFTSISDKFSDELLQCGIDYFSHFRDTNTDPSLASMELFRKAKTLAIGNIAKQRCQENTDNLQEWIDEKPDREKQKIIVKDIQFITSQLERFQNLTDTVDNAKNLADSCKPRLINIKNTLGLTDDLYLNISSAIVSNAQGMLVRVVNQKVEKTSNNLLEGLLSLIDTVKEVLDITFKLGSFDMLYDLKKHYNENLEALKSLAKRFNISTLHPKARIQKELKEAESHLAQIKNNIYFKSEIEFALSELNKSKEWHFMRSESEKQRQISIKQWEYDEQLTKSVNERSKQHALQQSKINKLKKELQQIDY